jgi:hydrazine synthase alpha subunit-like protein/F5/8 type C domain-containing protein
MVGCEAEFDSRIASGAGGLHVTGRAVFFAAVAVASIAGQGRAEQKPNLPLPTEIGEQQQALIEADWIDADRRFAAANPQPGQPVKVNAQGVTTLQDAAGAVDGVKNGKFGFHVAVGETDPWWQVDLGQDLQLDRVVVFNRTDGGHAARTRNIGLQISRNAHPDRFESVYQHNGTVFYGVNEGEPLVIHFDKKVTARIVRLHVPGVCHFALDEVEIYAAAEPAKNIAQAKPADQKSVSRHSRPGTIGKPIPAWAPADGGFQLAHSRACVQRAHDLVARLRPEADSQRLDPLAGDLRKVDRRLSDLESALEVPDGVRQEIHFEARRLLRKIAFSNPLLDFDKLLFVKRHRGSLSHMCDQYYGFTAVPGGGLFVLSDPFGDEPKLANLLDECVVENGRLEGQKLVPGSFLSPEVSYDGKTVLFACSENEEPMRSWDEVWPPSKSSREWTPTNCYHVFKVNADGSGLVQLTDGPWDDFDPCFLPNGRIVFISERRGGYVRCGIRACRNFNLCSMKPDGSDVTLLSYFDTNEWHPSVNNEGMIVFTRWDYIDRNSQIAHHLWTCYPDGRDARAPHGNYPVRRGDRPWSELSIRSIPGSTKYIATAAPHHGYAFGSLVQIDLRNPDDNANSQITRLTPEVPFPEAEGPIRKNEVYGTPWPLSEEDYLCAYDPQTNNHGIYWIDRYGNKELIYRDPAISSLSPMPLHPRPVPPVIPNRTRASRLAEKETGGERPSTIALMDVYDSDFAWPEGTKIKHLRVLQVLPKSIPSRNTPRIGFAEQTNARAVLGTVPVESDGSAYFEAPADKLIYFQALDARGMAVQSMRSGTYVHEGEQLTCQGCHERKHNPPSGPASIPLALRRSASKLEPEVDGSNPFNYVRLVQPVLDRNCVGCHQEEEALDLSGEIEVRPCPRDKHKPVCYTRSYNNLAEEYGFCYHAHSATTIANIDMVQRAAGRTIAGKFGARAATLMDYLDEGHYGVKLSDEDFHRMILWLDCNSEFLGAYENAEAQARGELVRPALN